MVKIKKAVIPVAGFGTRFLPVTKAQPKKCCPLLTSQRLKIILAIIMNFGIS